MDDHVAFDPIHFGVGAQRGPVDEAYLHCFPPVLSLTAREPHRRTARDHAPFGNPISQTKPTDALGPPVDRESRQPLELLPQAFSPTIRIRTARN